MLIKFRVKHPKSFKFLREVKAFLLIFAVVFVLVFGIFNGRAFCEQVKYKLRIGIEKSEDFLRRLSLPEERLYNIPDSILIPKININAPIISPETNDENILFSQLENGVVYHPDSVMPGQVGNTLILGHSSAYPWYKGEYGSIFGLLNQLSVDDQIIIFYQKHKYVYRITNKKIVRKNIGIIDQKEKPQLILISCWPVGTAWNRILIEAELVLSPKN